jgi:hypothetical protein
MQSEDRYLMALWMRLSRVSTLIESLNRFRICRRPYPTIRFIARQAPIWALRTAGEKICRDLQHVSQLRVIPPRSESIAPCPCKKIELQGLGLTRELVAVVEHHHEGKNLD